MSDNAHPDDTDGLQALVRSLGEALYNEPGESPLPMASTDAEEVIKAQLTENTGTHFLDSGFDNGRHWQQNEESPPWEDPEWDVGNGYVTHNLYHFMDRSFARDRTCVALESALYAFGHTDDRKRDAWLTCMEGFAESILSGELTEAILTDDLSLPADFVGDVLAVQAELQPSGHRQRDRGSNDPFTVNTYNGECHGLSQVLQGTNLGGPYAEYVLLQVHQGADVRGGYTGPRVYEASNGWIPHELSFRCEQCDWSDAESVLYGDDDLLYQPTIDPFELEEKGWLPEDDEDHPALEAAHSTESIGGAVFHRCRDEPGYFGHVNFM